MAGGLGTVGTVFAAAAGFDVVQCAELDFCGVMEAAVDTCLRGVSEDAGQGRGGHTAAKVRSINPVLYISWISALVQEFLGCVASTAFWRTDEVRAAVGITVPYAREKPREAVRRVRVRIIVVCLGKCEVK